jgi:hypothetical protein
MWDVTLFQKAVIKFVLLPTLEQLSMIVKHHEYINGVVQTSLTPAPTSTPIWCPIWTVFVKLQLKLGHEVGICKLDSGALLDASTLVF